MNLATKHSGDNVVDDVQTKPRTSLTEARSKEGVEDPVDVVRRDPDTIIADAQMNTARAGTRLDHDHAQLSTVVERMDGRVVHQICYHLPEGARVAVEHQPMGNLCAYHYRLLLQLRPQHGQDFVDDFSHIEMPSLLAGLIHRYLLETADQIGRTLQVAEQQLGCAARIFDISLQYRALQAPLHFLGKGFRVFNQGAGYGHTVADRRIQFVRHACNQRTQCGQFFRTNQFPLRPTQCFQCAEKLIVDQIERLRALLNPLIQFVIQFPQGLLRRLPCQGRATRLHHLTDGSQHRLQPVNECLIISTLTVGNPGHGHQLPSDPDRQTEEGRHRRVSRRQPTTPGVYRRRIGDNRLTSHHRGAEECLEVMELQSSGRILFIEFPRRRIPGDIGDGVCPEIGSAPFVVQHLANESVLALRQLQQIGEQRLERAGRFGVGNKIGLGPCHGIGERKLLRQRLVECLQRGLGTKQISDILLHHDQQLCVASQHFARRHATAQTHSVATNQLRLETINKPELRDRCEHLLPILVGSPKPHFCSTLPHDLVAPTHELPFPGIIGGNRGIVAGGIGNNHGRRRCIEYRLQLDVTLATLGLRFSECRNVIHCGQQDIFIPLHRGKAPRREQPPEHLAIASQIGTFCGKYLASRVDQHFADPIARFFSMYRMHDFEVIPLQQIIDRMPQHVGKTLVAH